MYERMYGILFNAIADSLMEKISQFVESASEAEVWEETWEIR